MKVHLLATVRNPALLPAALLVFRSIRTGFPTASIHVWGNGLAGTHAGALRQAATRVKGEFINLPPTMHDRFIEQLILNETEPCWLCDTDVIFWENVEHWQFEMFAGRWEPSYYEQWNHAMTVERLHTCLQFLNPVKLRIAMRAHAGQFPDPFGATAEHPFIRQTFIPRRGFMPILYDTTAGLWQAGMGEAFTDEQNSAFDHLHAATYADLVSPHLTGGSHLAHVQAAIYEQPELARGIYDAQKRWYEQRSPTRIAQDASPDQIRQQLRRTATPDADQRAEGLADHRHDVERGEPAAESKELPATI